MQGANRVDCTSSVGRRVLIATDHCFVLLRYSTAVPQLHYDSVLLLTLALKAARAARADREARGTSSLQEDALTAILLSAAAAEAFINELPEHVRIHQGRVPEEPRELSTEEREIRERIRREHPELFNRPPPEVLSSVDAMAAALEQAEAARASTVDKYDCAKVALTGSPFGSDRAPMQPFIELMGLRDSVMHLKHTRYGRRHKGERLAQSLGQRGVIEAEIANTTLSPINKFLSPGVAAYAYHSALGIVRGLLSHIPVGLYPIENPAETARGVYSDETRFPTLSS